MKNIINFIASVIVSFSLSAQSVQPSIMVVPFKKTTENYLDILENDRSQRIAVAKLDEYFLSRSVRTINFLAQFQNRNFDRQLEHAHKKTVEQLIAEKHQANVIAYIDADYQNYMAQGEMTYKVNLTLTAIDVQSSQIMASAEGSSKVGSFDDQEYYIKDAINRIADNFLNSLNEQLKVNAEDGIPMKLSIALSDESQISLFDEVGDDYNTLMDEIEKFLRENAHNNYLRCPMKVANKYECDDYRIPLMHPHDPTRTYTSSDFYRKFNKHLRKYYQLYSEPVFVGTNLRITICGKNKCNTPDLVTHCSLKFEVARQAAKADNFQEAFSIISPYLSVSNSDCQKKAYQCIENIFSDHSYFLCNQLFVQIKTQLQLGNITDAAELINSGKMISPCFEGYADQINELVSGVHDQQKQELLESKLSEYQSKPIQTFAKDFIDNFFSS